MSEVLVRKSAADNPVLTGDIPEVTVARPVVDFIAAINRGDLDAAVAQLAPNALHHGRISNYTPEGVRVLFSMLRTVFPDLHMDIRDMKVEGNRVITRIVATGTHTGSLFGKQATGKPVAWQSVDIAEVEFDHEADVSRVFKRFWDLWNDPEMWKEIGFIPAIMC